MSHAGTTADIEALAAALGEVVYLDIAKWHLYLPSAHLHIPVAEGIYPLLDDGEPTRDRVEAVLQSISVKLGNGRCTVSLRDAVPDRCLDDLMDCLQEYRRDHF